MNIAQLMDDVSDAMTNEFKPTDQVEFYDGNGKVFSVISFSEAMEKGLPTDGKNYPYIVCNGSVLGYIVPKIV